MSRGETKPFRNGPARQRGRAIAAIVAAAAILAAGKDSPAQSAVNGIALNQFEPAPAGDAFFGVPSPHIGGRFHLRAVVMFDYAHEPLRFTSGATETGIVSSQGFLRVDASLSLLDRVLVSVDMPFALIQSGEDPPGTTVSFNPPGSPEVGDLRIGLRSRLLGDDKSAFQVSIGSYFFAPTGGSGSYAGEGAVRGAFSAIVGGEITVLVLPLVWTAAAGITLRGSENPHVITLGAGLKTLLWREQLEIGAEAYGARSLGETPLLSTAGGDVTAPADTSVEVLGDVRFRLFDDFVVGAAGGPGLLSGVGTPTFRAVMLAGWSPKSPEPEYEGLRAPVSDRDNDGFRDDIDACPDKKGELVGDPSKDGCPPEDRDGDKVLDQDDACPAHPGVRTLEPLANGCPKDSDADGVHDLVDACPDARGPRSEEAGKSGCPVDRDNDKIPDEIDACPVDKGVEAADPKLRGCPEDQDGDGVKLAEDPCPKERGAPSSEPGQSGCPKLVRVVGSEIVLLKPIEFRLVVKKGDVIEAESEATLREVVDVIKQHPEFIKVEVQGHTDDAGDPKTNQKSSQERADVVMRWLIGAGLPAELLTAAGYGHTKPVADNRKPEGRKQNRRISFAILEQRRDGSGAAN